MFARFVNTIILSILLTASCKYSMINISLKDIPNPVLDQIEDNYPTYDIENIYDLDPLAACVFQRDFPNQNPGIVEADFDSNGFVDMALLLKKQNNNKTTLDSHDAGMILIIFMQKPKNVYTPYVTYFDKFISRIEFITKVPKGKVTVFIDDQETTISLNSPGVQKQVFDTGDSVLYYWNGNGFSYYLTGI